MKYRKTYIGLEEVDFELLKEGDLFLLKEGTGELVGCFIALSDTITDSRGEPLIKCERVS